MKKSTEYRMLVLADRNVSICPVVDLAQQVNGHWLGLEAEKTAEQLNEEAEAAFELALSMTGSATYYGPVKLVSYAYGQQICRAWEKAEAARAKALKALPACYHATRARRFNSAR
jgi:hypothetical protein